MLEDVAILTNGRAITEDLGVKLESIKIEDLGQANKVTIDKDTTTIVDGAGRPESIAGRVNQLRAQVEDTTSDYDREKLLCRPGRRRMAKCAKTWPSGAQPWCSFRRHSRSSFRHAPRPQHVNSAVSGYVVPQWNVSDCQNETLL